MTNLTLTREMQNMAERLAENSHDIWAKKKKEEVMLCGKSPIIFFFYKNLNNKNNFKFRRRYSQSIGSV